LHRERHTAAGVLQVREVPPGRRRPREQRDLVQDPHFGVLEVAAKLEHVGGNVDRLRVDAQAGVVGPVARRGAAVHHRVQLVVPPGAEGVRRLGHRQQEVRLFLGRIRRQSGGDQEPTVGVLVVNRLRVEDLGVGDDIGVPTGKRLRGPCNDPTLAVDGERGVDGDKDVLRA